MSTPLPTFTFADAVATRRGKSLPSWAREPLLHFIVLGALLFALDQLFIGRIDDPRRIIVDADVDNEATQVFKAARGEGPSAAELNALRQVWIDNEVLYREGLALEVDKGDTAIRERVIFKTLSIIDANVKLPSVDDHSLRSWFEQHRDKYDEPARYSFQEAVLSGDTSEAAVRSFVIALNTGTPGDAKAGLRIFKDRPLANLHQSYGTEFAKALENSRVGEWQALQTRSEWRAVRLDSITPPKPAVFEPLRAVIFQDWKDAVASEQRTAAVRALAKKYKIEVQGKAK